MEVPASISQIPTASLAFDIQNGIVIFDGSGSSDDTGIRSYLWAFGDSRSAVTASPHIVHAYPAEGTYTARLIVIDTDGQRSEPAIVEVEVTAPSPIPPQTNAPGPIRAGLPTPTDPDGDGLYEDVNGNGRVDYSDVALFAANINNVAGNAAFDFNGDGTVDIYDVSTLALEVE